MPFLRRFSAFFLLLMGVLVVAGVAVADVAPVMRSNVKVLPTAAASANALSAGVQVESIQPGLMNLSGAVPAVAVGDVLIDKQGRGTASKVVSVITGGGSTTVRTEQATLLDIFEQADIKTARKLGPSNFSSVQTMLPGVTYKGATSIARPTAEVPGLQTVRYDLPGLGFNFDKTKVIGTGGSLGVNGSISVRPSIDLDVEIRKFPLPKLTKCNYVSRFETNTQLTISAKEDITFVDKKFLYAVLTGTPITFAVGPIPVVITPIMNLYFQVNSNAKAGLIFTAQDTMAISGGFNWDSDDGLTPVKSFEHNVGYSFDAYAKMKLEVTPIRPELTFYIYSLEGPNIYLDAPKITTNVELLPDKLKWQINGSVIGGAAFKSEILGVKIDLDTPVTITDQILADGEIPLGRAVPTPTPEPTTVPVPIASLQITPSSASVYTGSYQQFSAQLFNTNGSNVPLPANRLNWTSSDTGVATIDAAGAARGIAPGSVTITANDTVSGKSATASLSVGYGPNVVTNTNYEGYGSLSAAIDYANVIPGTTISFRIPKSDPNYRNGQFFVTAFNSVIEADVVFDGSTEVGFLGVANPAKPLIVIDNALPIRDGVTTLKKVVMNWYTGYPCFKNGIDGTLNISSDSTFFVPDDWSGDFDNPKIGSQLCIEGMINNAGSVNQGNEVWLGTNGRINNTGVWSLKGGGRSNGGESNTVFIDGYSRDTQSRFINTGTVTSAGDCYFDLDLRNSGTITSLEGTLDLYNYASYENSDIHRPTFENGTIINGAGIVRADFILNGTATINGTLEIKYTLQSNSNGKLVGSGTVNWADGSISGTLTSEVSRFNWSGGNLLGTLDIAANGKLTLPQSYVTRYVSGTLNNAGQVTQQNSSIRLVSSNTTSGRINNSGTWTIRNSPQFYSGEGIGGSTVSLFVNSGTVVVTGNGSNSIGAVLNNTGTIDVQSGTLGINTFTQISGSTLLSGGSLNGTLNLKGGILAGSGNAGTINNSGGTIRPGDATTGTISIDGDYTQSGTGALELQLGGATPDKFDRLTVSGTATLGGNVNVAYVNGFVPAANDKFAVMTHQARSGKFAQINATALPGGSSLGAVYNANDVTLQAASVNRAPVLKNATLAATQDVAFFQQLAGTDADGDALTYKIAAGVLPAGLRLSQGGRILGTPTRVESQIVTIQVADGKGATGTGRITINVAPGNHTPVLNDATLSAKQGIPFSKQLAGTDADGDRLSYKVKAGVLPAGLRLLGKGLLYGTPARAESQTITIQVSDGKGGIGSGRITFNVAQGNRAPTLSNSTFAATTGVAFSKQLAGADPDGDALSYRVKVGVLPAGLRLRARGKIEGTPTAAGTQTVTIRVLDGKGGLANAQITFNVTAPAQPAPSGPNFVVTVAADSDNGNNAANDISLREAIKFANARRDLSVISFDARVFGRAKTIVLRGEPLFITNPIQIVGPAAGVTIDAGGKDEALRNSSNADISHLNFTGARGYNGAIFNYGTMTLSHCSVYDNLSSGISNKTGILTLIDSQITGNRGGGISNSSNSLTIPDDPIPSREAILTVKNCTFTNNSTDGEGGAIFNGGTLSVADSTFANNSAPDDDGGAISSGENITISGSTFSGNSADGWGGAIFYNGDFDEAPLKISNSTFSGNSATDAGGAIFTLDGLTVIENCTLTDNTAPTGKGGALANYGSNNERLEIANSIVAQNNGSDVAVTQGRVNSFVSKGYNLVGKGNARGAFNKSGDTINVTDARLGSLRNNGGPTRTHALLAGSLAFNAGDAAFDGRGKSDQRGRGFDRVLAGRLDIGAYESSMAPSPASARAPFQSSESPVASSAGRS